MSSGPKEDRVSAMLCSACEICLPREDSEASQQHESSETQGVLFEAWERRAESSWARVLPVAESPLALVGRPLVLRNRQSLQGKGVSALPF